MTGIFSTPPKSCATSPSKIESDDEWSLLSHSEGETDFSISSDSEDENAKVIKPRTSSVNPDGSSKTEKGNPKELKDTTNLCMPEMDLSPEDQATLDFMPKKELQKSPIAESTENEQSTPPKAPTVPKPRSRLAKMVKTCDSLAEKAANEVDTIARALSRKLDKCYQFRTSKEGVSTPEQSLKKCERFRDDAGRLYKKFERQAYAAWEKLKDEEYIKYRSIFSESDAMESNYRQLRRKAAIAHRLDTTVASYAKWKEAQADHEKERVECNEAEGKAWHVYKKMSGDAWKKYKLEKEEARDAYERVSAEYKRAKSLMSDLTEWSDLPEWKQVFLFVGVPAAAIFALFAVANVWDFFTSPAPGPMICSKAIGEMVKAATKEQRDVQMEQRWRLLVDMLEKL
ncbi:hypothetical protein BLS_001179 [Venturia inaequalis]|uniref:Uncharacterized protein n=1 Tax=Venturia inaequalis TaxID=5025 RepID=A0A8H3U295_VENIN|nr:hypothetical protein BLS_001179 [Venturia inaequalis]KAE9964966.1 hypothetical protein EG327_000697 [Venturia inaequalis]RDI78579.1 hypothetical protein Vi05172_g11530 [Venturia inaequalis]